MKLDLACGANCADGYEGVDIARVNDKVVHVANLLSFPWPFADESVDELRSSHFVEHIPMSFWHPEPVGPSYGAEWTRHLTPFQVDDRSVELFLRFFAECWRILKPGGTMRVYCPHGHSDRAFQDPSHRRFIVNDTWNYLDHEWRRVNGLQHAAYGVECNFPLTLRETRATGSPQQLKTLEIMPDIVQDAAVARYWNMLSDFDVTLVKAPIPAPAAATPTAQAQEVAQATA